MTSAGDIDVLDAIRMRLHGRDLVLQRVVRMGVPHSSFTGFLYRFADDDTSRFATAKLACVRDIGKSLGESVLVEAFGQLDGG